ncbi:MAG: hypothetical protein UV71_C0013G0015 [Microgenomates group bacterium GW2011_GWC1_43_13]|nr:MAG: hypothetical protein UV71_C0013G0015 [Microgenomates group bacterium GW2011_GWC1_43_13]
MLLNYSGIISILLVWPLVVFLSLLKGLKYRSKTISQITGIKRNLYIINSGLILGSIFQVLFLYFLSKKFPVENMSIFIFIYLTTILAAILTAIFPYYKYLGIHTFVVKYFFIVNPLSLIIFGYLIRNTNIYLSLISIIIPLIYYLGIFGILKAYKGINAIIQIWEFSLLSLWIILISLI